MKMTLAALVASAAIATVLTRPTFAQSANDAVTPIARCWIGSLGFSEGTTARASDKVMTCGPHGVWLADERASSICIREGEVFSTGAIESITGQKGIAIKCSPDGTWEERLIK